MGTLAAAYSLAWIAVALYVGWLGIRQRRIAAELGRLQSQTERSQGTSPHPSRAA